VLDVARGLQVWLDVSTFEQYLRRFTDTYADAVHAMYASLAGGDRAGAAALAHKLAGVAGNMALPAVHSLAKQAERVLSTDQDATLLLARLEEALTQAVAAIERFR